MIHWPPYTEVGISPAALINGFPAVVFDINFPSKNTPPRQTRINARRLFSTLMFCFRLYLQGRIQI